MHKLRIVTGLIAALLLVVLASTVGAQGQDTTSAPGEWASAINLQNVGTGQATISIQFFDGNGNEIVDALYNPEPLDPNGAVSIYVPALIDGLPPGQFSAVVSSDQPVLASVNTASTGSINPPWTAFAYDGFDPSQAGANLFFPGNYRNYYGFYSEIVIQNAGNETATLKGTFKSANGTTIAANVAMGALEPNAAKTFPMTTFTQLPSGNINGLFGVSVTSDESVPLVGIANIWRASPAATASYSGFTAGTSVLYPPGLYNNYYGFASALTVQNVHPSETANYTITYSGGHTVVDSLVPGAAKAYYQPADTALPSGNTNGLFAARVDATSGSVVGLVSVSVLSPVGTFGSYNVPGTAAEEVNVSSILSDYYGYFTGLTVQNTDATPTDVTITYATGQSRTFTDVPGGGAIPIIHLNSASDVLPFRTATSATVSSSNGNALVVVANHNSGPGVAGYDPGKASGDFLLSVTGVPK